MKNAEREVIKPNSRVLDAPIILFMLAALLFLYAFLFVPPFVPIAMGIVGPICVVDGMRLCAGEVMYRDFFQFLPPGTGLFYSLPIKIFGPRLWIPDMTLLLLGLGLALVGIVVARKIMRPGLALLPSAIFLEGIYKNGLDPTHHWFSLLAGCASIAVLMERRTTARIVGAGALAGLATCFTQTRGLAVVIGLGLFLWWESARTNEAAREFLKKTVCLVAGFLATLIFVNGFFVWKAGLARFLWCTAVFGVKYYPKEADQNTFRVLTASLDVSSRGNFAGTLIHWVFIYIIMTLIPILFFVYYGRESQKKPKEFWERPMLLAIVGTMMLLSVAPAPEILRMTVSALPEIILLGWFMDSPRMLTRGLTTVLAAGILLGVPYSVARAQRIRVEVLTTPQGQLAVSDRNVFGEFAWVLQHTHPSDYFFAALRPELYFYLDLRNPSPLPFPTSNGYTTAEQAADELRGLKEHPARYVLWPHEDRDVKPDWQGASDDHLGAGRNYIRAHYHLVKTFANADEIWERNN